MSEIIPAVEAVAGPLVAEAEKALAPEAAAALQDLHSFVTNEMDQLRADLPTLVGQGVEHLQNLGAELLNRYHGVIAKVEAVMGGVAAPTVVPPLPSASVVTPVSGAATATATVPQPVQAVVDPTVAPSTTPEASSAPSSTPSTSATTSATTTTEGAAPQA